MPNSIASMQMDDDVGSPDTKNPGQIQLFNSLQVPLDNCVSILQDIIISLKPFIKPAGDAKTSKWSGFTWRFKEGEFARMHRNLLACKSSLDIAINVVAL